MRGLGIGRALLLRRTAPRKKRKATLYAHQSVSDRGQTEYYAKAGWRGADSRVSHPGIYANWLQRLIATISSRNLFGDGILVFRTGCVFGAPEYASRSERVAEFLREHFIIDQP
jgi:hypothetical protein